MGQVKKSLKNQCSVCGGSNTIAAFVKFNDLQYADGDCFKEICMACYLDGKLSASESYIMVSVPNNLAHFSFISEIPPSQYGLIVLCVKKVIVPTENSDLHAIRIVPFQDVLNCAFGFYMLTGNPDALTNFFAAINFYRSLGIIPVPDIIYHFYTDLDQYNMADVVKVPYSLFSEHVPKILKTAA